MIRCVVLGYKDAKKKFVCYDLVHRKKKKNKDVSQNIILFLASSFFFFVHSRLHNLFQFHFCLHFLLCHHLYFIGVYLLATTSNNVPALLNAVAPSLAPATDTSTVTLRPSTHLIEPPA